jgi:anthranilate synthase component 1
VTQVVASQRLTADIQVTHWLYRALIQQSTSPYLFLVYGYTLDDHKRFDIMALL